MTTLHATHHDIGSSVKGRHVFDIHHHLGKLNAGVNDLQGADETPEHVAHIAMMDRFGFTAAAVQPSLQYERPHGIVNTREVNDSVASYRNAEPNRFPVALGTVEPLHGLDLSLEELDRIALELHLDGVTWHTRYQGAALNDPRIHKFIDRATERNLPCFVHIFAESNIQAPWMLGQLADDHPEAILVALDGFSGATQIAYVRDLAARYENILFDTALATSHFQPIDRFVETFGSDRLLFGTDAYTAPVPYNTPTVLHDLLNSAMDEKDLDNILWNNAARLFPKLSSIEVPSTDS